MPVYPYMMKHYALSCPVKTLLGVSCPTCGMGRSAAALWRGNFHEAVRYSPLLVAAVVVGLLLGFLAFLQLVLGLRLQVDLTPTAKQKLRLALAFLLVGNTLYLWLSSI